MRPQQRQARLDALLPMISGRVAWVMFALLPLAGKSHHWPPLPDASAGKSGSDGVTRRCSRSFGTTQAASGRALGVFA